MDRLRRSRSSESVIRKIPKTRLSPGNACSRRHEIPYARARAQSLRLKIEDARYQLMITDIAMPWMNGLQVAHAVRASGLRLPIILITARATADVQRQISALGGDAVLLRKPFALADLEAAVLPKLSGYTTGDR